MLPRIWERLVDEAFPLLALQGFTGSDRSDHCRIHGKLASTRREREGETETDTRTETVR